MARFLAFCCTITLVLSACSGGDADTPDAPGSTDTQSDDGTDSDTGGDAPTGDDSCGQGQAFPDDPEFREALCRAVYVTFDVIGTDAEIDPDWSFRITEATLLYVDDRDAALAELEALRAEVAAAVAAAAG